MFALRPYQTECIAAIQAAAARGIRRALNALPTGVGKTVIFAHLALLYPSRILVLVHRDELVTQTIDKLILAGFRPAEIGVVKAERDEHDRRVVVASVQTLSRERRLARLVADFILCIVDEGHHATADSYRRVLEYVGAFQPAGPLVLGFTATAERHDGTALGDVFEEITFERGLIPMIREKYLSDVRAIQVNLAADFHRLHTRAGDIIDSESEELLLDADAPEHVAKAYLEHAAGRKAIVFTPTVRVAEAMAEAFTAEDVAAEAVSGATPIAERRAILQRFHTGETRAVPNCAVLIEGYDEPSVDCVIVARPTKSSPLYRQMVGRGLRRYPGKQDCLILDVVGMTERHDLVTAATLLGFDPDGTIQTSLIQAIEEREAAQEAAALAGQLIARRVDLFASAMLNWVTVTANHFVLPLADAGALHLVERPDGWCVQQRRRDRTTQIHAQGLTVEYAQGVGEDLARALVPQVLIDRTAAWRSQPATPKQLDALRRCRVRHLPTLTKGEAADLLTAAIARRQA
jgi:ATP-dependent helicase IRC3